MKILDRLRFVPRPSGWIPDVGDRVRFANRWLDFHGRIAEVARVDPGLGRAWTRVVVELDSATRGYANLLSLVPARWWHRAWTRELLGARAVRRWIRRRRARRAAAEVRAVLERAKAGASPR